MYQQLIASFKEEIEESSKYLSLHKLREFWFFALLSSNIPPKKGFSRKVEYVSRNIHDDFLEQLTKSTNESS